MHRRESHKSAAEAILTVASKEYANWDFLRPLLGWYFRTIIETDASYILPGTLRLWVFVTRVRTLGSSEDVIPKERCLAMSSSLDHTLKPTNPEPSRSPHTERRGCRRCKITQLMRVRPSDPERDPFDDIRATVSVSRTGVYFHSSETGYEVGMRLFVSLPYSKQPTALVREYLAEVVRREPLPNGLFGIAFKILMELRLQTNYSFTPPLQRK